MKIEISIDEGLEEISVSIKAPALDVELQQLMDALRQLDQTEMNLIRGWQDKKIVLVNPKDVIKIFTEGNRLFALTTNQTLQVKERLYILEEQLTAHGFLRISQSELVNFAHVKELDLSYSGTIVLLLTNHNKAYVSRRFVAKVKHYIDL